MKAAAVAQGSFEFDCLPTPPLEQRPVVSQPAENVMGLGQPSSAELSTALNGSLLELNGRLNSTAACLVSRIVTAGHYDFSDFAIEGIRGSLSLSLSLSLFARPRGFRWSSILSWSSVL